MMYILTISVTFLSLVIGFLIGSQFPKNRKWVPTELIRVAPEGQVTGSLGDWTGGVRVRHNLDGYFYKGYANRSEFEVMLDVEYLEFSHFQGDSITSSSEMQEIIDEMASQDGMTLIDSEVVAAEEKSITMSYTWSLYRPNPRIHRISKAIKGLNGIAYIEYDIVEPGDADFSLIAGEKEAAIRLLNCILLQPVWGEEVLHEDAQQVAAGNLR